MSCPDECYQGNLMHRCNSCQLAAEVLAHGTGSSTCVCATGSATRSWTATGAGACLSTCGPSYLASRPSPSPSRSATCCAAPRRTEPPLPRRLPPLRATTSPPPTPRTMLCAAPRIEAAGFNIPRIMNWAILESCARRRPCAELLANSLCGVMGLRHSLSSIRVWGAPRCQGRGAAFLRSSQGK